MHPLHRPCLFALAALPARSRTIDLRGNVTHTGNLGSVPSRWLGGSVVRWLGSCANPQHETHASRPENEGLVPKAPIPKCRIIRKEQANIMQIACAVAGSVPRFSYCSGSVTVKVDSSGKVTAEGLLDSLILKLRGGWQNSSFGDKHPDWKPVMRKAVAPKKKE